MPPSCHGRDSSATVAMLGGTMADRGLVRSCLGHHTFISSMQDEAGTPHARIEGSLRTRCTSFSILDTGHQSISASATCSSKGGLQAILSQIHARQGISRDAQSMQSKQTPHKPRTYPPQQTRNAVVCALRPTRKARIG